MKSEISCLLDNMLYLNSRNRSAKKKALCSPVQYAKLFCTVVFDIGRGVGKTTYIANIATEKDVIIVERSREASELQHRTKAKVLTAEDIKHMRFIPISANVVYVDEATKLFRNKQTKDLIYELFTKKEDVVTFIFLG